MMKFGISLLVISQITNCCIDAVDSSSWACNRGTQKVGEVTIDWGHGEDEAAWACNAWEADCGEACSAEPAVSTWSCYIDKRKAGTVSIDWGHTAADAAWACNAWKIGDCSGNCVAGSSWDCKLSSGDVVAEVEIWWSNTDEAAAWACNKWIDNCNDSCQAENWIWIYFNKEAEDVITIDPNEDRGIWEGFGAGLSWWAHAVGETPYQSLYTKLFFGQDPVDVLGQIVPGLGLNMVRYNIGGGGLPSDNIGGAVDQIPSSVAWHKDIDGFWIDWNSQDPDSSSWDWTRDSEQRSVLESLRDNNVTVEFVTHAPMWWMMDSKSSCGGQLQPWNYRDHALYIATVVERARSKWGINVTSVEPFNEPTAGWWTYPQIQEGANIPVDAQASILGYLREELNARNLEDVVITASDENTMVQAQTTYEALKNRKVSVDGRTVSAASLVGKVNVHSYNGLAPWRDDKARQALRQTVGNKRIWMTEYGDGEGTGSALAQTIIADINFLRVTAWMYWQPLEPYSAWGLLNGAYEDPADQFSENRGAPIWLYRKYYVFAQFSRFLRPGYQLIGINDDKSIAAYHQVEEKLVVITLNSGPERLMTYDLSKFRVSPTAVFSTTCTSFDGTNLFQQGSAALDGMKLRTTIPSDSLQSLVISVQVVAQP